MLKKKILIFVLLLLTCLCLSISFASANNITDDDSYNSDYNESNVVDSPSKSFTDLNKLINNDLNKSEIILEDDFVYQDDCDENFTNGIFINKSIVINGNGHIIDAQNKSMIFNIKGDNVVIKNITFINANGNKNINANMIQIPEFFSDVYITGYSEYDAVIYKSNSFHDAHAGGGCSPFEGGAIYSSGNNLKIINSSFINNFASCGGGIFIAGSNSQLSNLLFINNSAKRGSAIFSTGKSTFISQSQFDLNNAQYDGSSIISYNNINIQNCNISDDSRVIFYGENWQLENMTSIYFNSFVKFDSITDFEYKLVYLHEDFYHLKIIFGVRPYNVPNCGFYEDMYGYSVNKSFCLNIDGKVYNLQTDENSQADVDLKLFNGNHSIEVYNPLTKLNIRKSFIVSDSTYNDQSTTENYTINTTNNTSKSKSFTDLNNLINCGLNKSEIILEDDFVYQDDCDENFAEGIFINHSMTIDGQGHIIDANKLSGIFYINASNVVLKNITFKNGNSLQGGAIYSNAPNITIINSTFINNSACFNGGAIYCNALNITIINTLFYNNFISNVIKGAAIYYRYDGEVINSTFINNYMKEMEVAIIDIYNNYTCNVINESISYAINCNEVCDVVSFENNYNVIIRNSTFRNTPTQIKYYHLDHIINPNSTAINTDNISANNTNTTNQYDDSNSTDLNKTNDDSEHVVPVIVNNDVDNNMSQITPTIDIIANNTYVIYSVADIVEIGFKTNIKNKMFWVEVPRLLSKTNITSNDFYATIKLTNITKGGEYTILCGFYDYVKPVVAGFDDIGVDDKKTIQIMYKNNDESINSSSTENNNSATANSSSDYKKDIENKTNNHTNTNSSTEINNNTSTEDKTPVNTTNIDSEIVKNKDNINKSTNFTPQNQPIIPVVKTSLLLKPVSVKKSAKKLVLQVVLKHGNKLLKGKKITFIFNGKKYTAKTNKKGIAKVTIKKNVIRKLKVGKKVKIQASYGNAISKKNVNVKK